jgi:hypothetical protein
MARRAKINFDDDLRKITLKRLAPPGVAYQGDLLAWPTWQLVALYINWSSRRISVRPRRVFRSRELTNSAGYLKHRSDVDRLLGKIAAGCALTPHLSKSVEIPYEVNSNKSLKGKALDLLLNDWNIHHLHISHDFKPGSHFVVRRDALLFSVFQDDAAYVLDVLNHKDFANEQLVRIAVTNWPDHGLFLQVNGVPGPHPPIAAEAREATRRKRKNTLIEIDGAVYAAPDGISSAGVSINATLGSDLIQANLEAYSKDEDLLVAHMKARPENMGRSIPARPSFNVVEASEEQGYGFGIRERTSGATIWVT